MCSAVFFSDLELFCSVRDFNTQVYPENRVPLISVIRLTFCMCSQNDAVFEDTFARIRKFQPRLQFVVVETESKLRSLVRHLKSCCMTCLTLNNRSISGTGKVKSDSLTCGVCTFVQGRTRHARGFRMCYAIMKHRMLNLRGGRFFHMNRNRYILISMLNKRIMCSMGM